MQSENNKKNGQSPENFTKNWLMFTTGCLSISLILECKRDMDTIFLEYLECDLVKKKQVLWMFKVQKQDDVYLECDLVKKKLGFVDVQEQKVDGVYLECDLVKSKHILLRNVLSHYLHPSPNLREQHFRVQLTLPTPTRTRFHQRPIH
jgi:hypothetical protein